MTESTSLSGCTVPGRDGPLPKPERWLSQPWGVARLAWARRDDNGDTSYHYVNDYYWLDRLIGWVRGWRR